MPVPEPRPTCPRCLRPATACWCANLQPIPTRTRIVFLQHPREAKVAIGTARIAHLGLASSELHEGIDFTQHPRITELVATPGTALLFPGENALPPHALPTPPDTLLVIDGTWPQARKIIALNPHLRALPRIGFVPRQPGNYRIRREPAAHCVATLEAVVEVLQVFERDQTRFSALTAAFEAMVERQLHARAARTEPARRCHKSAGPWWESPHMPDLDALWPHLIAWAGEANAYRRGSGVPGHPELIQLAARRLATGETFHAFLAPRRPLAPNAPRHLDVPANDLIQGQSTQRALEQWSHFVQPDDRLLGWGTFTRDLLARENWRPAAPGIDLRPVAAHRLKRRPGTVLAATHALGAHPEPPAPLPGRAGRTVAAIAAFTQALLAEKRAHSP